MNDIMQNLEIVSEILKKKQEDIKETEKEYDVVLNEQQRIFADFVNKLKPVFDYIKKNRYYFRHPKIDYATSRGPIVGIDRKKGLLFVHDLESNHLKEVKLNYEDESKLVSYYHFFRDYSFEDAIEGLLYTTEIPERISIDLKNTIKEQRELVNKYDSILKELK